MPINWSIFHVYYYNNYKVKCNEAACIKMYTILNAVLEEKANFEYMTISMGNFMGETVRPFLLKSSPQSPKCIKKGERTNIYTDRREWGVKRTSGRILTTIGAYMSQDVAYPPPLRLPVLLACVALTHSHSLTCSCKKESAYLVWVSYANRKFQPDIGTERLTGSERWRTVLRMGPIAF